MWNELPTTHDGFETPKSASTSKKSVAITPSANQRSRGEGEHEGEENGGMVTGYGIFGARIQVFPLDGCEFLSQRWSLCIAISFADLDEFCQSTYDWETTLWNSFRCCFHKWRSPFTLCCYWRLVS